MLDTVVIIIIIICIALTVSLFMYNDRAINNFCVENRYESYVNLDGKNYCKLSNEFDLIYSDCRFFECDITFVELIQDGILPIHTVGSNEHTPGRYIRVSKTDSPGIGREE